MKAIITAILCSFLQMANAQSDSKSDTINNNTIMQLQKAGLGKEVLLSKINSSICQFNLSTENLISLKKAGITDEVIAAMMNKENKTVQKTALLPSTQNKYNLPPGIYYLDAESNEPVEMEPSVLTNQKSGGLGEALKRSVISGLFNAKVRASLSEAASKTKLTSLKPVFIFVFDTTVKGLSTNAFTSGVQSPNEFILVQLNVVKDNREIVVGKHNNISSNIGVDEKLKVDFSYKKLQRGVYEINFTQPLDKAEYSFMFASTSMYQGNINKVYDFGLN